MGQSSDGARYRLHLSQPLGIVAGILAWPQGPLLVCAGKALADIAHHPLAIKESSGAVSAAGRSLASLTLLGACHLDISMRCWGRRCTSSTCSTAEAAVKAAASLPTSAVTCRAWRDSVGCILRKAHRRTCRRGGAQRGSLTPGSLSICCPDCVRPTFDGCSPLRARHLCLILRNSAT